MEGAETAELVLPEVFLGRKAQHAFNSPIAAFITEFLRTLCVRH